MAPATEERQELGRFIGHVRSDPKGLAAVLRRLSRIGAPTSWRNMNLFLIRWLMRKYKKLAGHKTRAAETLKRLAQGEPDAFIHWSLGYLS